MNLIVKFDLWNVASYASLLFICYQYQCLSSRVGARWQCLALANLIEGKCLKVKGKWWRGGRDWPHNPYPFLLFPQNNCYRVRETPLMTLIAPDNIKRIFRNSRVQLNREWPPQWSSSTWPSAPSWPSSCAAASLAETESPSSSKTPGSCQEQQAAGPSLCLSGGAKLDILMCDKCSRKKVWHTYTSVIHCHNDILLKTPQQKFHP